MRGSLKMSSAEADQRIAQLEEELAETKALLRSRVAIHERMAQMIRERCTKNELEALVRARARIGELEQAVLTKTTLQESAEAQLLCVQVQLDAERAKVAGLAVPLAAVRAAVEVVIAAADLPKDWDGTADDLQQALLASRDAAYERGRAAASARAAEYVEGMVECSWDDASASDVLRTVAADLRRGEQDKVAVEQTASLPAPRQLSAAEMAEATSEARELRAALDRATAGMEEPPR